jgi:Tol biopolymer transport system component
MIKAIVCSILFVAAFLSNATAQQSTLFGANIISTEDDEFGITFSPDGTTCFFTKRTPSTISSGTYVICYSRFINNKWTTPEIAPFSGRYKDLNPFISPDGSKLFFISNRPGPGKTAMDGDIWMVKK